MRRRRDHVLLSVTELSTALATFVTHCVEAPMRERFVHEAAKRPDKLAKRICHHTHELFMAKFHNGKVTFDADEPCLALNSTKGFQEMLWKNIEGKIGSYSGLLISSLQSPQFYAGTEAPPAAVIWGGYS